MEHLNKVNDILANGDRKAALQYLKSVKWSPAGMTGDEIRQRYPWASTNTKDSRFHFGGF